MWPAGPPGCGRSRRFARRLAEWACLAARAPGHGTLAPFWSWRDHPEDHSGKHRTTGLNIQVACGLDGRLAWVPDPAPGSAHDSEALRASGLLDIPDPPAHIADKA
ncbi:MAG: transposase family protein [Bifidobacteriaceae bacterium]|nr:transposase family protein [Bifidobacteriaceae bacterium]